MEGGRGAAGPHPTALSGTPPDPPPLKPGKPSGAGLPWGRAGGGRSVGFGFSSPSRVLILETPPPRSLSLLQVVLATPPPAFTTSCHRWVLLSFQPWPPCGIPCGDPGPLVAPSLTASLPWRLFHAPLDSFLAPSLLPGSSPDSLSHADPHTPGPGPYLRPPKARTLNATAQRTFSRCPQVLKCLFGLSAFWAHPMASLWSLLSPPFSIGRVSFPCSSDTTC